MASKKSTLSWWLASYWYAYKEEADGTIDYPWLSEVKCIRMCDTGCIGFTQTDICINPSEGQQIFLFHWQGFLWQAYFSFVKISAGLWTFGKVLKQANVLWQKQLFRKLTTGLIVCTAAGRYKDQLMMVNGITFAWLGKTVMALGNSTKMESCNPRTLI